MNLKTFKQWFYIFSFLSDFLPIMPLYAIMFSDRGDLNITQISSLFFIWTSVALVAEIPTGMIADKISKRASLILCYVCIAFAFTFWLTVPTFLGYAIGFVLWGIGFAFKSGSYEAYLYEVLESYNSKNSFSKIYSSSNSIRLIGMFLAYIVAAVIVNYGYEFILKISVGISILVCILLLKLPKDTAYTTHHTSHLQLFITAYKNVTSSRILVILGATLALIGGLYGMLEEYVPLYYSWNNMSRPAISLLLSVSILANAYATWIAHRFEKQSITTTLLLFFCSCLLFIATGFMPEIVAIVGMFIFTKMLTFTKTIAMAKFHHAIESNARATSASLIMSIATILALILYASYIFFKDLTNELHALFSVVTIGIILTLIILLVTITSKKSKTI